MLLFFVKKKNSDQSSPPIWVCDLFSDFFLFFKGWGVGGGIGEQKTSNSLRTKCKSNFRWISTCLGSCEEAGSIGVGENIHTGQCFYLAVNKQLLIIISTLFCHYRFGTRVYIICILSQTCSDKLRYFCRLIIIIIIHKFSITLFPAERAQRAQRETAHFCLD